MANSLEQGRINLQNALCTVLEEATQRVELAGERPEEDAVVLALRTALCAHLREKRFAALQDARDVLEHALNEERGKLAIRASELELELAKGGA